jgi:hypothetical protein
VKWMRIGMPRMAPSTHEPRNIVALLPSESRHAAPAPADDRGRDYDLHADL